MYHKPFEAQFPKEPEEERIFRLSWATYLYLTESYDRGFPHIMRHGEALLSRPQDRRDSEKHARKRLCEHQQRVVRSSVTQERTTSDPVCFEQCAF